MSTKNLARTVIEGGRSRWCKSNRRHQTAIYRARVGDCLNRAMAGAQLQLEDLALPKPPARHRELDDKLAPAKRWLRRQVGRPWDAVRGELLRLFDTRTTAGRHIVFDHMLPWVEDAPESYRRRPVQTCVGPCPFHARQPCAGRATRGTRAGARRSRRATSTSLTATSTTLVST
jgi:hypothetical protein